MLDTIFKVTMTIFILVLLIEMVCVVIVAVTGTKKKNKEKRKKEKKMMCSGFDCIYAERAEYPWCQIRDEYCDMPFLGECCHVDKKNACETCKNKIRCYGNHYDEMSKYKQVDAMIAINSFRRGETVLAIVFSSKRFARGMYVLNDMTFGEVEDLTSEEITEDVRFFVGGDHDA